MKELLELEENGWRALSTSADAAKAFYANVLRDDVVMIFPGGIRLTGKSAVLASFAAQPWAEFDISEPEYLKPQPDVVVLFYRVMARREDSPPYAAIISSTYTCVKGEWKLALHQHSPA